MVGRGSRALSARSEPGVEVGRFRTWIRLAWYPLVVGCVLVLMAGIPAVWRGGPVGVAQQHLRFEPGSLYLALRPTVVMTVLVSGATSIVMAALIYRQEAHSRMGLFLSYYLLGYGVLLAGPIELLQPLWPAAPQINSFVLLPIFTGPITMFLLATFPDGEFVPRWSRWLVVLSMLMLPGVAIYAPEGVGMRVEQVPLAILLILVALSITTYAGAIYAQVHRYRWVSDEEQRRQTKWVLFGVCLWLSVMTVTSFGWLRALSLPQGSLAPWWLGFAELVWVLSSLFLPISMAIAILRHQLFDINILINRTLTYGLLTAGVLALYALIVGGVGVVFQSSGNLVVSLLATGLVAVLFQPLRQRLQAGVNRFMFGEREDPVAVLSSLGQRLEVTVSPDEVLESIVETVAQRLKLPYAAVAFDGGAAAPKGAAFGKPSGDTVSIPILYQSVRIGRLIVAPREGESDLDPADQVVLESIAHQAGAAVQAARLTADLQRSRQELVAAREEERRRLRRDLHDGLGPQLASQTLTLEALERKLKRDPEGAVSLLESLKEQSQSALQDIRRLVYDLRPPALDELGLQGAISQLAAVRKPPGLRIRVVSNEDLPTLPAAVEVAAYRIAQEGITNVIRHSGASRCKVSLEYGGGHTADRLRIEIEDDGRGIGADQGIGVGLISMRERAEELGGSLEIQPRESGGTIICALLPFPEESS